MKCERCKKTKARYIISAAAVLRKEGSKEFQILLGAELLCRTCKNGAQTEYQKTHKPHTMEVFKWRVIGEAEKKNNARD